MKKSLTIFWMICVILTSPLKETSRGEDALPGVQERGTSLSSLGEVFVGGFQLEGNTVFSDEELAPILEPYENRVITAEELQEVKDELSRYYITNGYVNSGAVIPDQELKDGVIRLKIIEGRLTRVTFTGLSWLRERYVESRLLRGAEPGEEPLNMYALRNRLKLIKQDPLVENIHAELSPGHRPGEAHLTVEVKEAKPWRASLAFNNYTSPGVGSYQGEIDFEHMNLSGWGDALALHYALTEGLNDYLAEYTVPVTRWDTTISIRAERQESTVVADPFGDLDIKSETTTYSAAVHQPLFKTLSRELILGLELAHNKNNTSLLGEPFAFSGSDDGENKETVLHFTQQWMNRSMSQAVVVWSSFNLGLDAWDATILDREPDGEFFSWQGQFQWTRLFETLNSRLLVRLGVQLSDDPLLPQEKFAIGGSSTVRGYRENQMTTDNGVVGSVEWRIPVTTLKIPGISKRPGDGVFQLAPFFDYGQGWNTDADDPVTDQLYSVGLGARWYAGQWLQVEIYWGHALKDVEISGESDLQDDGVSFQIRSEF
ncbi:MAG: ShlB/FhaC/HecB family hemolysin secretion/activation protein [Desulfobacterales bacterium]|nr:ShlB/FhaC/HecB family hemolysin secretion/activation protein [Desulfobacterales bacterium]